jgi:arylsulfatase A-like enzyme
MMALYSILRQFHVLVAVWVAVVMLASDPTSRAAEAPPNIVYILLDDAGYGDLSIHGQKHFSTPNMDRLGLEGIRFTDHYSASTVCAPTRCGLMTGRHTGRAYVRGNREIQPEGQSPLPADIITIPRLLKKAGYRTGVFGKWGLGAPGSASDPMEHFDAFFGYNCQRHAHVHTPDYLWRNRERMELDGRTNTQPLIMNAALDFIRESGGDPFFVYLAIAMPHAAMQAPDGYDRPFREQFAEFEGTQGRYGGVTITNPQAQFAGMMTAVDDGVGELLAVLAELGLDERTLVMLSSDNGPHREGGHQPDFFQSAGEFRGYKRDLTEGGIRTFFLARWPGVIEAGRVSGHVSAQWDMLPTFCELAGVKIEHEIDGLSLVPSLLGRGEQEEHPYLYWEFYERGGRKAARWGNWKAVQYDVGEPTPGPIEIYDLGSDRGETRDLAAARPDLVEHARSVFEEAHQPSPDWVFSPQAATGNKTGKGMKSGKSDAKAGGTLP